MRLQSLLENTEFYVNALKRVVPKSVLMQYRNNDFDNVLTTPGAAINLFRVATNQVKNDGTLVKIVKILFPYMLRDLGDMFGAEKSAKEAYKLIYSLVYKTTEYDEWKPAIPSAALAKFLDEHKKEMVKLTLKEFKEFMNYGGGQGHPTTIRLATILRRLQMIVDWPELKPIYLGLHNYVFDNINTLAAQQNYNAEHNLIDYISRNHVNLNQFPKIKEQLDAAKVKILREPMLRNNDIGAGILRVKWQVETLKEIGLDWSELNDMQAVYALIKPDILKKILTLFKESKYYRENTVKTDLHILKNYYKLKWPELDAIEKSVNADSEKG